MNAPWKPGAAGVRDPFAAFICDEGTLDILRSVVTEMGWPPEKCSKGGLRHAIQTLSVSASPSILLVDLSESGDPINDINALAEVCEPGTVVIALGQVNDVRLYRDLVASGIQDYLLKPLGPDQMRDALTQAQQIFAAPKHLDPSAVRPHVNVAVIGARGGVGASTIASSLAWLFSSTHKRPTALLDLDVHFGTGALAMDLEPGRGLTDAIDNPSRIDGLFIERAMIKANEQLSILSAEAPISSPLMTDGGAFMQLLDEFRQAFEMSVVDLPRSMLINFPQLLNDANVVVLTTELTLPSARDAIRLLSWLKSNAPQAEVIVVANKIQAGISEISRADFEASIERKVDFMVPFDLKSTMTAAKLGQPLIEAAKVSKATQAIKTMGDSILALGERPTDEKGVPVKLEKAATVKSSLMGKLGDFKSLMPKKAKK